MSDLRVICRNTLRTIGFATHFKVVHNQVVPKDI